MVRPGLCDHIILEQSERHYLEPSMSLADVTTDGCEAAVFLGVCSVSHEGLLDVDRNLQSAPNRE